MALKADHRQDVTLTIITKCFISLMTTKLFTTVARRKKEEICDIINIWHPLDCCKAIKFSSLSQAHRNDTVNLGAVKNRRLIIDNSVVDVASRPGGGLSSPRTVLN
ncbi:hypothetical protein GWI33_000504 [Rhynchophorus ferrugineus]|uniref:Uncharacterized protein n=1 Tax=Rhynchophorus ferrugineus TaxID=354439 RepID=A0A834HMF0_RHYFE|nr:hypothetical protein GWI33_000504 [Rhynchophorus ferrugineus]